MKNRLIVFPTTNCQNCKEDFFDMIFQNHNIPQQNSPPLVEIIKGHRCLSCNFVEWRFKDKSNG